MTRLYSKGLLMRQSKWGWNVLYGQLKHIVMSLMRPGGTNNSIQIATLVLVIVCGGCGSAPSDEGAAVQVQPTASIPLQTTRTPHSPLMGDTATQEITHKGLGGQAAASEESEDGNKSSISAIPLAVAKDLHSPDARMRNRALDFWETKGNQAHLDPVFEAMEDEDPTVRAKATAIIEHWAAELEREGG